MAPNPPKNIPAGSADSKSKCRRKKKGKKDSISESSSHSQDPPHAGLETATSLPGPASPANRFDFSAMTKLLNDPKFNELAVQLANDPSFKKMANQLDGSSNECDIPEFDVQTYLSFMEHAEKNPQFVTMANALLQDPSMLSMLEIFSYPTRKAELEELMAPIKENSTVKHVFKAIETGGAPAMISYWNNEDVLQKLGEAMDLPVSEDRATFAGNSGPEETEKLRKEANLALEKAIMDGDVKGLKALVVAAGNDGVNDSGSRLLHLACRCDKVECAKILIEAGVAVDALATNGQTPLHAAVIFGKKKCVDLLLKNGASSTLKNSEGKTPIDIAKEVGQLGILKLMTKR